MSIGLVWLQFLFITLVIGIAGYYLSVYADAIAEKTGLGRNWIGAVLLATVTSLPELMTGISSVSIANVPNLAIGNILGACIFNLALVFMLDALYRERSIYSKASHGHLLSSALGCILLAYVGFGLVMSKYGMSLRFVHIGLYTTLIPVLYALAMRTLFLFEREERDRKPSTDEPRKYDYISLSGIALRYALAASVVVAAGTLLPFVGERLVVIMNWNQAFVGTTFIAFATALPELAVTLSTLKIGAVEMALSNILASNLFNVVILFVDDILYVQGPIFKAGSSVHIITAFSAIMMTGLVMVGLVYNPKRRIFNTVSAMSLLLLAIYVTNAYVTYRLGE